MVNVLRIGVEILGDNVATVKLAYSSFKNISFKGTIDTEIEREEWEEMSVEEQDEIITDATFELVEVYEVPD